MFLFFFLPASPFNHFLTLLPPWHLPGFWGLKGNLPEAKLTIQSRNPNTPPHTHNHNTVGSKIFPPFRRSRFRCDIFVFRKISFSMAMALLCSHTMGKMIGHHPPHRARARRKFNPLKRVKSCVCVCEVYVALNVCTSEAILDRLAAESCLTTLNCVPFAGMPFCQGAVVWSYPPTKIGLSSLCRRRVVITICGLHILATSQNAGHSPIRYQAGDTSVAPKL